MGTKIKFAGARAKKCDDLVSAEERMALLVGPQAELTYKKRNEEFMRLLVDNEDEALHRQLLKKLEEKIFLMNESTGGLMNSTDDLCDSSFHNQSDSNVCVADKEVRQTVSPVGTDKDDVSELRQQEVEGQSQTHQSESEPVNWILRVVDGIANPVSRFWELEFHNKNRTKLSSPNKTKSVKLHFTQSAEKDAKTYSIGCLQIPTSSEGNNNSLNTKDSEVLYNAECGKTNIEFEMNDEEQLMNMLDLAYKLDGDIVSEVMRTIDQTLNGEIAESSGNNELMSTSMSTLMRKESEENVNNELIVLPEQTFTEECAINRGTSEDMGTFGEYAEYSDNETLGPTLDGKECVNNILNVPYSPIRRHTNANEMEEGEIIDANENDRSLFDREQISKEQQSMLQCNSEKREEIFEDSVPEPMTPPCPNIPADFEKNIASPKTPPPEEPSRFKEVIERREKEGFLGIITLDSDDE